MLHTTGSPDSALAPRQYGSQHLTKRQKIVGEWHRRKQHARESKSLQKLIKSTKSKLAPTEQQILDAMNFIFQKPRSKTRKEKLNTTSGEIATARQTVEVRVREMLKDWKRGGHGHINQTKTDGFVTVYLKNFNSLIESGRCHEKTSWDAHNGHSQASNKLG